MIEVQFNVELLQARRSIRDTQRHIPPRLNYPALKIPNIRLDMAAGVQVFALNFYLSTAGLGSMTGLNVSYNRINKLVIFFRFAAEILDFNDDGSTLRFPSSGAIHLANN